MFKQLLIANRDKRTLPWYHGISTLVTTSAPKPAPAQKHVLTCNVCFDAKNKMHICPNCNK